MRAREGLALVLWYQEERQAAIEHAQALLRLNPGDNQGIRYRLITWLLVTGDDAAARQLLDQYKDDGGASWEYSRALLLFRRFGEGRRADRALAAAIETNPYVMLYLLGARELPDQRPALVEPGGETEAIEYVGDGAFAWLETPGSLEWLVRVTPAMLADLLDTVDDDDFDEDDDIPGAADLLRSPNMPGLLGLLPPPGSPRPLRP
jgi:hypothetical protein